MKKLSLILALAMMLAAFSVIFTATATAASSGSFKVGDKTYTSFSEAYYQVAAKGGENTIEVLSNCTISSSRLELTTALKEDIIINGNGFTVVDTMAAGTGVWKIDNGLTYSVTINNLNIETDGFWQLKGRIICNGVKVYGNNATNTNGSILFQKDTHVTFTGDSYIQSCPTYEGTANSANPVFKFNETSNITVDIAGNTEVAVRNSLYMGSGEKGAVVHNNVTFNVYDNAYIHTTRDNILFSAEWKGIGFNMYGGTVSANGKDSNTAFNIGGGNGATGIGSYVNIYGGTVYGSINWDSTYCDFNYFGGNVKLNGARVDGTLVQVAGAGARTATDSTGLRFRGIIPAATLASINEHKYDGTEIEFGTLIVPYNYLEVVEYNTLSHDTLKAAGIQYLDIAAKNGIVYEANGDITINAAITNIKEHNKAKDFVATIYVKWIDSKGVEWYAYSNAAAPESSARSAVEVANLVLADVKDAPTGEYVNAVTVYAVLNNGVYTVVTGGATKYSKYTQGQLVNVKKMYPIA